MPLLFNSQSHGEIPFGFFNIETDMLLLDRYFFFARDMASHVGELAGCLSPEPMEADWEVYTPEEDHVGNLMGAIAGVDLRGFIGEVYSHFPFPCEQEKFKQNPEGWRTRGLLEGITGRYALPSTVRVKVDPDAGTIAIGDYCFSRHEFGRLLEYLWLGGYPRWKDALPPDYIVEMRERVEKSGNRFFHGLWSFGKDPSLRLRKE